MRVAPIGPIPITLGSTPNVADVTTRASGVQPCFAAAAALQTSSAAAPSLSGDEFPAVTVPFALNAGLSFASDSIVVSGRGGSSCVSSIGFFPAPSRKGTSSPAKRPLSTAALHFIWLS